MRRTMLHPESRTPPITDPQRPGESLLVYLDRIMFAVQHDLPDEDLLSRLREVRDIERDMEIATEKEVDHLDRTGA